jgi:hypothetical protein
MGVFVVLFVVQKKTPPKTRVHDLEVGYGVYSSD